MSLFLLLLAAVVLSALQVVLLRLFGLRGIVYRRSFSERAVYEGQKVLMVEELSNAKLLPVPWLRVEARMSQWLRFARQENLAIAGDLYHRSLFTLAPWRKITRTHEVTCLRRGCYRIDSVALTCGDLLGMAECTSTVENHLELLVYPRILDFNALYVPSRRWQGDVVVHRFIEPDPFLVNGIRGYRPGDSLRDVHWAATARTGALKVKTRDYTASPRLMLLVNMQLSDDQWGELSDEQTAPLEENLALAATYAAWAHKNGVETAFLCNGRYSVMDDSVVEVGLGGGQGHLMQMLETMARVKIIRRRSFATWLDDEVIPRGIVGCDIVVISSYWSTLLEERAGRLRRMDNSVTWVNPKGGAQGDG